jgi:hypothetical protein
VVPARRSSEIVAELEAATIDAATLAATCAARAAARAQAQGLLRPPRSPSCSAPTERRGARAAGTRWACGPVYKRVDTCAAEFATAHRRTCTRTYEDEVRGRARPTRKKVIVLGGGPNRIGQGIEFDYCCVPRRAARCARTGFETIMVNCNPETVSHRLRHLRPPVLRAAHARGRARDRRHGASPSA